MALLVLLSLTAQAAEGPGLQQQKLFDLYGQSVCCFAQDVVMGDFNGDGFDDLAVADRDSDELEDSGSVTLFYGSAEGVNLWDHTVLHSPDRIEHDTFGWDLAEPADINGDGVDDLVVSALRWGAYRDWSQLYDTTGEGAVYVFFGAEGGLSGDNLQKIQAPTPTPAELFGHTVSSGGDLNGDGYADVVVTSRRDDPECEKLGGETGQIQGAAYVFTGSASGLNPPEEAFWGADSGCSSTFGDASALIRDLNGDGHDEVLVGAYEYDDGDGAAHLFYGSSEGLDVSSEVLLKASGGDFQFGWTTAGIGDINSDGHQDMAILANGTSGLGNTAGTLYVYLGSADGPGEEASLTLVASDNQLGIDYGHSLANVGDLDGDGYPELVVGANGNAYGENPGTVYLYAGSASGPQASSEQKLTARDANARDFFGLRLTAGGDLNGDGIDEIIITAKNSEFGDLTTRGALYILSPWTDADGDGVSAAEDCDDDDATVGAAPLRYRDLDGDGHTTPEGFPGICEAVKGYSEVAGEDCDDTDPGSFPGNKDVCGDGVDSDCDGMGSRFDDEDGDGLTLGSEEHYGTDPCDDDTDGDGIPDGEDPYPTAAIDLDVLGDPASGPQGAEADDTAAQEEDSAPPAPASAGGCGSRSLWLLPGLGLAWRRSRGGGSDIEEHGMLGAC